MPDATDRFVQLLTSSQGALRGYVLSLLPDAPIDLGADRLYYVSFVLHRGVSADDATEAVSRLLCRSSDDFTSRFGFGVLSDGALHLVGGANTQSHPLFPSDSTCVLVGKIVAAKDEPDQMFFTLYGETEIIEASEPNRWSLAGRTFDSDAVLDYLVTHGVGVKNHTLDEIRIGTSWESVVPNSTRE